MRIGSDINSLSIVNRLNQTNRAVTRALERLGTGRRINSARDDSATFSMSLNLEAQTRGLRQGILNLNQAQGALETADSAISSQLELVQRMRELALQASNGSLTAAQRLDLDRELRSIFDEFRRITGSTEFNGNKLLNGSFDLGQIHLGLNPQSSMDLSFDSTDETEIFTELQATGKFTDTGLGSFEGNMTVLSDVNADGLDDLVMTASTWGGLGIRLSNGDGTFQSLRTYAGPASSTGLNLRVEDVNNDHILDVIYNNAGTIATHLGNGDGTFDSAKTLSVALTDFTIGDFNQDGKQDLITIGGSVMSVFNGNGDGTYSASLTRALAGTGYAIASEDINGDGKLDLAIGVNLANVTTLIGNGNGTFAQGATISTVTYNQDIFDIVLQDFNKDGNIDIVTLSTWVNIVLGENLSYALGNGNGTFGSVSSFNVGGFGDEVEELADMNGDDLVDILVGPGYYLNLGNGTFSTSMCQVSQLGTIPGAPLAGDVNGDGILDLMTADYDSWGINLYLGRSRTVSAVDEITIKTQAQAQNLMGILDTAIQNLTERQAQIASLHSRIDSATSNNLLMSENLDEARSKAIDADFAEETAELVRNQILQQAQVAVLAQANLQMQTVLQLLKE